MTLGRVAAIAGRILQQFRRDPRTLALIVIVPLAVMALAGYLISEDKEPLQVGFVDRDSAASTGEGPTFGQAYRLAIAQQPGIELVDVPQDGSREDVEGGEVAGVIVVGGGTTAALLAGKPAVIEVVLRGVDSTIEGPVLQAAQGALVAVADQLRQAGAPEGVGAPQVRIERRPLDNPEELRALDAFAPALIVTFVFFFTFLLTSVSFLRERASGTLERLMASPVSRLEVLLGYLLGFLGFALLQALIVLGYAVVVLDVRAAGPIWLVFTILAILVIGVVSLGIALSFYARNELQVIQFIPLVFIPQILLGGLVWPVETLLPIFRWISQAFPLTHAVAALRSVMIGGAGIGEVGGRVGALATFSAAMLVLGVTALRKQRA